MQRLRHFRSTAIAFATVATAAIATLITAPDTSRADPPTWLSSTPAPAKSEAGKADLPAAKPAETAAKAATAPAVTKDTAETKDPAAKAAGTPSEPASTVAAKSDDAATTSAATEGTARTTGVVVEGAAASSEAAAKPQRKAKRDDSKGKKKAEETASVEPEVEPSPIVAPKRSIGRRGDAGDDTASSGTGGGLFSWFQTAPVDDATASADDDVDAEPVANGKKPAKRYHTTAGYTAEDDDQSGGGLGGGLDFWGSGTASQGSIDGGVPTLSPANVEPLKAAIARYRQIVAKGGWPIVPMVQMGPGMQGEMVLALRRRLEIEGDLAPGSAYFSEQLFEQSLSLAVQRFQMRNGLKPTGDLLDTDLSKNGTRTLKALNVPATARLKQLEANLDRLMTFRGLAGKRYVMVNIPAQQIEAVEDGRVVLRLAGVVGKPDRPSPLLTSTIQQLKFNPTWTLPPTVVKEDLIPKGRKMQAAGQDVLAKFGIDAYGGSGKLPTSSINWSSQAVFGYRYSQQPGPENPLGFVKIDFPSPQSVYMHDTPSPRLFEKAYRAASSGCIRVQHIERLAAWLLRDNGDWSMNRVMQMKATGESMNVSLKRPVALHWVYITAWASPDGTVYFRRDLYKRDVALGVDKMAAAY
ncbi:MAG: L,D-transpeptidase family protein [Hyphomicrobiaceae bacterium]